MQKLVFDPKKDFDCLKYPVFSVEKNLLDKIKELAAYAELLSLFEEPRTDIDNLLRYVMVLYDKKSPLIRAFTNLDHRKKEAAVLAGYSVTDVSEENVKRLEALFSFTDPILQAFTLYFLEEQNNMWFCNLISNEQTFYEYQKALLTEAKLASDKDKMATLMLKSKIQDECDKIAERVETYYTKVYGDGEEKAKAKNKDFSPEGMARRK